jgi:hypothetical protein
MCNSQAEALRRKYGRYLPWERLNVDQVPLPFVNDMDYTYEEVGTKRVAINQGGPALSKRMCTGQLCFRGVEPPEPTDEVALATFKKHVLLQPAPCIVFRGQGNIKQGELDAYPKGLIVLWQKCAWVDRPTALDWVDKVIVPFMAAQRAAGVADESTRYLLFQDNLDAQKEQTYIDALKACGVDDHKVRPTCCALAVR